MRKYLKPALEMEAFDVADLILTASGTQIPTGNQTTEEDEAGIATPIDAINLN